MNEVMLLPIVMLALYCSAQGGVGVLMLQSQAQDDGRNEVPRRTRLIRLYPAGFHTVIGRSYRLRPDGPSSKKRYL